MPVGRRAGGRECRSASQTYPGRGAMEAGPDRALSGGSASGAGEGAGGLDGEREQEGPWHGPGRGNGCFDPGSSASERSGGGLGPFLVWTWSPQAARASAGASRRTSKESPLPAQQLSPVCTLASLMDRSGRHEWFAFQT